MIDHSSRFAALKIALVGICGVIVWGNLHPAQAVSPQPARGSQGMVVTSQHLATDIGLAILKQGGNAVDAAVAVGFAEAVVNPCCGNIGGGGFMVVHLAHGKDVFLNFREKAPNAAREDMYLDQKGAVIPDASLKGYKAVAIPGTVMGLARALEEYGTMPLGRVMAPAIRLAREGFILTQADIDIMATSVKDFAADPAVAGIFLHGGKPYRAGERLRQPALGRTLALIARKGPDAFYKGSIAEKVAAASAQHGGIVTAQDFADYTVTEGEPLSCTYRGYRFLSAPPPSSGGVTLCEILNIVEAYPLRAWGFHSAQSVHVMVEAMRHAYLDRNFSLGDPAFVKNPLDRLLSKDYAGQIRAAIKPDAVTPSASLAPGTPPHEGTETTHYSIIDKAGNAVSVTYTINALFGAKVIAGDTGFFLNDEMDDFTVKPGTPNLFGLVQGKANAIAPGKRPLSSMSPTIVTREGEPFLILGSPGGSRIITITLETAMNVIDYGMNIAEAVDAPRFHHQWLPDTLAVEPGALGFDTARLLSQMGYQIVLQTPWGAAEAIARPAAGPGSTPASSGNDAQQGGSAARGFVYGANDDRRPAGSAAGY
ncbi:MAG TPA: gamma-glutamyltransferase [Dongiaceae bacterium]|jgi:gamma-glutamyltranspeptidase/glutathione hydrolase|nr:gamma-glutamyltransferase [Dongiaceae bacterium]